MAVGEIRSKLNRNFRPMCYHKSLAQKESELLAHYDASFQSITEELDLIKEKFNALMHKDERLGSLSLTKPDDIHNQLALYSQKDSLPSHYNKQELSELKWCLKTLTGFTDGD